MHDSWVGLWEGERRLDYFLRVLLHVLMSQFIWIHATFFLFNTWFSASICLTHTRLNDIYTITVLLKIPEITEQLTDVLLVCDGFVMACNGFGYPLQRNGIVSSMIIFDFVRGFKKSYRTSLMVLKFRLCALVFNVNS